MAPDAALEIAGLTKRFGQLVAVDEVRFDVPRGSVFGFLGPNGSGKTTTLGMLTGLIPMDAGTARIFGHDVREDLPAALSQVGALIEEPAFYPHLTGRQNLVLLARLQSVSDPEGAAARVLAEAGLEERAWDARYKGYSLGMRRRLGLAAALLADPPVLILDEPTNGLDPAGQREVRALLKDLAARDRTVLVSSHILHEVQETCTHVAIIHKGRIIRQGRMAEVLTGEASLRVQVDDAQRAIAILRALDGVRDVTAEEGTLRVLAPPEMASLVNRTLVEAGLAVSELTLAQPALEERFLEITKEASA